MVVAVMVHSEFESSGMNDLFTCTKTGAILSVLILESCDDQWENSSC